MAKRKSENRPKTEKLQKAKRKAPRTAWKPGETGNAGGRPKLSLEQKAARLAAQAVIDAHTEEAAWTLVELLAGEAKLALGAAGTILDRSDIKGTNRLQITGADGGPIEFDLTKLSDAEARAFNAYLKKTARPK